MGKQFHKFLEYPYLMNKTVVVIFKLRSSGKVYFQMNAISRNHSKHYQIALAN